MSVICSAASHFYVKNSRLPKPKTVRVPPAICLTGQSCCGDLAVLHRAQNHSGRRVRSLVVSRKHREAQLERGL